MSDDPLQDALDQLDALAAHDGRRVTVSGDASELAAAVARELSKPGGPQISSRAISNR